MSAPVQPIVDGAPAPDGRALPRTNLFLSAVLEQAGVTFSVRVRNLSASGALVEGPDLPEQGAPCTLKRGSVEADCIIAWSDGPKRGVHFARLVPVEHWTGKTSPGQQRVDAIQAAIRSGLALPGEKRTAAAAPAAPLDRRIAAELGTVHGLLEAIGDELTGDMDVVTRHMSAVQQLDRAQQMLAALEAVLKADDRANAIAGIAMSDLRARLS